jgi:hypothetical protein
MGEGTDLASYTLQQHWLTPRENEEVPSSSVIWEAVFNVQELMHNFKCQCNSYIKVFILLTK